MNEHAVDYQTVAHSAPSMGGTLSVFITAEPERSVQAQIDARRTVQRVETWAARLTRFNNASHLSHLNSAAESRVLVRPTLAAALHWAKTAERRTDGVVDSTLLDARLAAESATSLDASPTPNGWAWQLLGNARDSIVERDPGVRIDLDGTAKGWIADRAADLLARWPGVVVDADGDIALRADRGVEWLVDVADPRLGADGNDPPPLATLKLRGGTSWTASYGVATSGTSVHRWQLADGRLTHHLIDWRTRQPAATDVVQATVVAPTAREAEIIAKSAVILGSHEALGFMARSAALAAILLLDDNSVVSLPGVEAWLA
ncbi:MAG: FAD:protein FMN transferase [Candidatus Limnocylindrales bacterium]